MNNEHQVPNRHGSWKDAGAPLLTEISLLEERIDTTNLIYSGLKDLDEFYRLVELKLDLSLLLINHPDHAEIYERTKIAGSSAREALLLSDSIQTANISLDQKDEITNSEEMGRIREKLQRIVLFGGAALFDSGVPAQTKSRRVAAALRKALLKYTGGQHQQTGEKIRKDDHLAVFEIPEGDESIVLSDRMTIPLSQAVFLIEEELLPAVEKALEDDPGNPQLIQRRDRLQDQAAEFKTAKFFPRARPLTFETDLFTASLAGFSADGEALVTVDMQTIQSTGNTYDHLLEHLKVEIVRDCIGTGVSEDLDKKLRMGRSSLAGRKFSMTEILNKLDIPELFSDLTVQYPFLRRLQNRDDLKLLADLAAQRRKNDLRKVIAAMTKEDRTLISSAQKRLRLPST